MKHSTRIVLVIAFVIALLTTGFSSIASAQVDRYSVTPQVRVVQTIDENNVVRLHRNTHPAATPQNDRGPVPDSFDADHILLVLQRSPEQEQMLDKLIDELNDRNSPNFHKWLTPEEYARFGVAQDDIDKVTGWLEYHGFRVNQVYSNGMMIDFAGTAGQIREAFHTSIHNLNVNGEQHVSNMSDPVIPRALAPVVRGITSLNDFKPHPMYKVRPDYTYAGCTSSSTYPTEPGTCYAMTPQDDAAVYNLNPLFTAGISGQGQTVVVVEDTDTFDTNTATSEWGEYRSAFGLSAYTSGSYTQVHPGSCTDPGHNADDGEAAIDVEMVTTFAPSATVELISCGSGTFTFGGIIALANLVSAAGPYPGVVSMSYGACEAETGDGGTATFSNVFQQAASEGISVFASTGDSGPVGCSESFTNGTEYDIASLAITGWGETAYNVAVGGTDFEDVYNSKEINSAGGWSATVPLTNYWNTTSSTATTFTGGVTSGSKTVTAPAGTFENCFIGATISGTDISSGATITAVASATSATMSANATATDATDSITISSINTTSCGSAKSYIPEIPWNDACGSVLISEVAKSTFTTYGSSGFCNEAPGSTGYLTVGAAAGGASNCATGVGGTNESNSLISAPECQGYPKPSWQSAYGVPTDGLRDIPDVAMFAANGDWGHFQTVCWDDTSETSAGATAACSGLAPSSWSGFGGTSVAAPSLAGIQALVNQKTGEYWGNPNPIYYSIAQSEYGTQGGTFIGSSCNSDAIGGPGSTCVFNDVTQGDIDGACEYNSTTEEAHCYKPSGTYGIDSTDVITAASVLWGGSGYTTAPTCTIAGPTNNSPYKAPSGTTLYAGGSQATCTAAVTSGTTTAVWTVSFASTYVTDVAGLAVLVGTQQYTLSGTTSTTLASNLCTSIGTGNTYATCSAASGVATLTAKTAGAAGNFQVNYGPQSGGPDENETLVLYLTNTTKGQGPNYVSGITITAGGAGYGPETPITLGGPGTGAVAVANTSTGTAASAYEPAYGAAPGYDLATGLGSVNANNLVNSSAWTTGAAITCTGVPSSEAYNSSFTISCSDTDGIPVSYYASSGGCTNSGATYTMTSSTTSCTIKVAIAQGSPTTTYTVTATTATATVTLTNMTQTYTGSALSPTCSTTPSGLSTTITGAPDTNAGSYSVTCTVNSGQNYTGSASGTFVISPATATVTLTNMTQTYTGSALSPTCSTTPSGLSTTITGAPDTNAGSYPVTCTINSGQNYTGSASGSFVISPATATVTLTNMTQTYTGSALSPTCSTTPSGLSTTITGAPDTNAGSYPVTCTINSGQNYTGSASGSFVINKAANTVTFTTTAPATAEYGSNFTVAASGLDTNTVTYTSDGVVCTNSGATYTMIASTGTCTVTATQASDTNYNTANASESVTAEPANASVSVSLTSGANPSTYGQSITFTATVSSDTGAVKGRKTTKRPLTLSGSVTWSGNTGCSANSLSGNPPQTATCTTSILGGGTDTVTATYSDSNHNTGSGSINQTVDPATNTVTFTTPAPASSEYGSSFTVAASGLGTGAITYTSGGSCSNSGATYTMTSGSGTCTVTATQAADADYQTANASESVTAEPANASVSVALTSGTNPSTYGQSVTFTATITTDTGAVKGRRTTKRPKDVNGSVSWSANTGCSASTVSGTPPQTATCTTSILPGGSDTVTATYTAGDGNHNSGVSGSVTQTVNPAANTVTFTTPAPSSAEYGSSFTVAASGLGTGAITYTSDGVVCTNSGATYTMIEGSGTCTVTATQAADADYQTANASESVTAEPAVGSVSVTSSSTSNTSSYGQSVTFTATVTSDTGAVKGRKTKKRPRDLNGSVTWSANTGCSSSSVSGNSPETATCTTSTLAVGSDTVTASYTASDSNHTMASGSVTQTVNQAAPSISVTLVSPSSEDFAADSPVTITAQLSWTGGGTAPTAANVTIGGNGNGTYGSTSCGSPSGNTITCNATYTPTNADVAGSYNETASFASDTNYSAATSSQTGNFTINNATTITSINSGENPSNYGDSVTFTATVSPENGDVKGRRSTTKRPKDVTGSVQWSDNTGCGTTSVTWTAPYATATCTVSSLGAGSNTVTAQYLGDSNHGGSTGSISQTVNQASQTITFTSVPTSARYLGSFTVTATGGGSGNAIVYTSSGSCTNSGATYTMNSGTGTCSVIADQAGNSNYSAAPEATASVNALPANQTITITTPAPSEAYDGATFTVAATASSGLPVTYSTSGNDECTNSGATFTITAKQGTCNVRYTQPGNSNYLVAPSQGNAVTIIKAVKPTVSFTGAPAGAFYQSSFTVTASSSNTTSIPTVSATGSCAISGTSTSGTTVTATINVTKGTASCALAANWAATDQYLAAKATQSTKAELLAPTVSLTGAPSSAIQGATFTVTATSNESGSYAVVPKITVSGGVCKVGTASNSGPGSYQATVTMTKASGTCTINAAWKASDGYAADAAAPQTTTAE